MKTRTEEPLPSLAELEAEAEACGRQVARDYLQEKFGEGYAFSPNFFAVHREEPTMIRFWNLQPDDNHAFMLISPRPEVLMHLALPPLKEIACVFTFHEEGLYSFVCSRHPKVMFGQILVLPPRSGSTSGGTSS